MATKSEKMKIETAAGCQIVLDPAIGDDWELMEMMSKVDTDPTLMIPIFETLLGADQYKKIKDNLRKRDGKVSVTAMTQELTSIFESTKALKNS